MPTPDHFVSTRLVAPVMRWLTGEGGRPRISDRLPILMYHSLSDDPEPGVRGYYRLNTPPSLFLDHLRLIRDEGFAAVNLSTAWQEWNAARATDGAGPPPRKLVALTFDDGYRDFLIAGAQALIESGFSATMFLPTAFIGRERASFKDRHCLNWDEVRELRRHGIEFGSHTVNHPKLWELTPEALEQELSRSRITMEAELEAPVTTFAHPYAFPLQDRAYVDRFRQAMTRTGYRLGVTTTLGCVQAGDDPLMLKRLPANGADDASLLRAKLHGAYDWLAGPQRVFKALRALG